MAAKSGKLRTSRFKGKEHHNELSISTMREGMENGDINAKYLPYTKFTKLLTVVVSRSGIMARRLLSFYTPTLFAFF